MCSSVLLGTITRLCDHLCPPHPGLISSQKLKVPLCLLNSSPHVPLFTDPGDRLALCSWTHVALVHLWPAAFTECRVPTLSHPMAGGTMSLCTGQEAAAFAMRMLPLISLINQQCTVQASWLKFSESWVSSAFQTPPLFLQLSSLHRILASPCVLAQVAFLTEGE